MEHELELISSVYSVYSVYYEDIRALRASLKPTDGLLGFGKRPDSDPCHGVFTQRLEKALTELVRARPSGETAKAVLRLMFAEPKAHEGDSISYWMLIAVHGMCGALVPFLSQEEAAELSALYRENYPKHTLLPVQIELLKSLDARGGKTGESKKRFGFFGR